jgi:hypothetical protein
VYDVGLMRAITSMLLHGFIHSMQAARMVQELISIASPSLLLSVWVLALEQL